MVLRLMRHDEKQKELKIHNFVEKKKEFQHWRSDEKQKEFEINNFGLKKGISALVVY